MRTKYKVLLGFCAASIFVCVFAVGFAYGFVARLSQDLPNVDHFINSPSLQTSDILDRNGNRIGCIATEGRYTLPADRIINTRVAKIIVAKEDHRYWERAEGPGKINFILDFYSIARAIFENISAKRIVKGGSTIVQQTAKQILPPEERSRRTIERKIKEILIAGELTKKLDRKQILAFYLNQITFGNNQYGAQGASLYYFSEDIENLSVRQCALLAGIIKAPAIYSPRNHPRRAKIQLNDALKSALKAGVISQEEYYDAYMDPDGDEQLPLDDTYEKSCSLSPYATRSALDQMRDKLGFYFDEKQMTFPWTGLRIHTTIDAEAQKYAEEAVSKALNDYHNRLGDKAIDANGAMVVIENKTGQVIAIVGGADYKKNKYNVALNGKRQAGSAFKPIIYASYFEKLVENGILPENILDQYVSNTHISCRGATKWQRWNPKNFDDKKFSASSYPIRTAIAKSINRCALHAATLEGTSCALDPRIMIMARRLGINIFPNIPAIDPAVKRMLPIAIGGADISPLELTRAYSVFANGGILKEYNIYIINHIANINDETFYTAQKTETQVISSEIALTMVEALRQVVVSGTARSVLSQLPQLIAGKTGTTNNYSDAWFCGFTADITSCVWIGSKDKTESLGDRETGGKIAAPAFKYFIEQYYQ